MVTFVDTVLPTNNGGNKPTHPHASTGMLIALSPHVIVAASRPGGWEEATAVLVDNVCKRAQSATGDRE